MKLIGKILKTVIKLLLAAIALAAVAGAFSLVDIDLDDKE